ncbi:energy-coupling factor ABC transporter substrate-binding protein [Microtetraspora sp. AC03309]|uniref:energy-coupling factor ABC transporter substrate-binding protein n=1 Tax=Microtetraspora sp. AC03309 TaxID=2779376 RepID=UPI001E3C12E9|nr:energy-coupling factor ABC transporter substrate-binding protein [Microtetraspora sp. AC03309]MCC5582125.1 energy-coupling factor ABC transporter substrate-binding protein [Microtetraspora sp. AC03309]
MKRNVLINLLLLAAVAALAVLPLAIGSGEGKEEPFTGADAQAETAITELAPDYEPWFASLYEPPSGEIESALFALQAAIGAGFLGYYFGVARTRNKLRLASAGHTAPDRTAAGRTAAGHAMLGSAAGHDAAGPGAPTS